MGPPSRPAVDKIKRGGGGLGGGRIWTPLNSCKAYRNLAMELIFLCRFFVQTHEQNSNSSIRLRKVLIAADDALNSAVEVGDGTTIEVDKKFGEAIDLLSAFEKDFPSKDSTSDPNIGATSSVTSEAMMSEYSGSPLTVLGALKKNIHSKPMGNNDIKVWRDVTFRRLRSLPDTNPIVVNMRLSGNPSIQEVLWNFSRVEYKTRRLTLRENPHFYEKLPTSAEGYGDNLKINPIEDFRHTDKFYVLTDKPEMVHIMNNQISRSFGNFWCPSTSIIFKDTCGTLTGEGIVIASLRGTYCGFCERLPVPAVSGASTNSRGLPPIITEGCSLMGWKCSVGSLPMHSSVDVGLCICTGRAAQDIPLLVPLPPTSEQPGYCVAYKTHIHILDNDSLLQIFDHYRLNHKYDWNGQLMWRKLTHVCRRWRSIIFNSWFHLDIRLHLTIYGNSRSVGALSHLPPLPLVIDYSIWANAGTLRDRDNVRLGLQQHGRVCRIDLMAPLSRLRIWLEPMNTLYPRLEYLSLSSTTVEAINPILPETFLAPDLRHLALHGIGLPKGLPLLSSSIILSSLSLTNIRACCYFPPVDLVTQLQGLPLLEELSIGFAIPIPLPSSEGDLLPFPILPVTLPILRRLTFRGVDVYLDNFVAQINAPLLERLTLKLFFSITFTLMNLNEFVGRIERFEFPAAEISFSGFLGPFVKIVAGHGELPGLEKFSLHISCGRLDWLFDSAAQVCGALTNVMSTVEDLEFVLHMDRMPSDWDNTRDDMLWNELLLPFLSVKKLRMFDPLTLDFSQVLESTTGGLDLDLLPKLQKFDTVLQTDRVKEAFSMFAETRRSMGRPVHVPGLPPAVVHAEPEISHVEPEVSHTEPELSHTEPEISHVEPEVSHRTGCTCTMCRA